MLKLMKMPMPTNGEKKVARARCEARAWNNKNSRRLFLLKCCGRFFSTTCMQCICMCIKCCKQMRKSSSILPKYEQRALNWPTQYQLPINAMWRFFGNKMPIKMKHQDDLPLLMLSAQLIFFPLQSYKLRSRYHKSFSETDLKIDTLLCSEQYVVIEGMFTISCKSNQIKSNQTNAMPRRREKQNTGKSMCKQTRWVTSWFIWKKVQLKAMAIPRIAL